MQENKTLVEEALIQMKNVEEAIAENAKGILASTMKEEINQLVKESLSEEDEEDEVDAEVSVDDMDTDNEEDMDMDMDTEDDMDSDIEMDMDIESDETPIDLTDASDEEILKVFKAMGEEDGIIVKKDGEDIHLTDNDADTEYIVKLGESEENQNLLEMDDFEDMDTMDTDKVIQAIFEPTEGSKREEDEEVMYEITFDDDSDDSGMDFEEEEEEESYQMDEIKHDDEEEESYQMDERFHDDEEEESYQMDEIEHDDEEEESYHMDEETIYEIEFDESIDEAYDHKKAKKSETKEGKMSIKPKGLGIGSAKKFKYPTKVNDGGFDEDKKVGPKTMGTGKAKFSYKKGENMNGKSKVVKKAETKEAARTLGMGSKFREGGLPKPRAHSKFNTAIKKESLESEVSMLREKNEEYRKALNVFREKLNEVAIFNSNLAYATRLFTEHSTTKKEKINILRRFDDVESLKESKNLYKSIKDELNKTETKSINESVEKKINNTVSSGSATNLIESKTYENPQFMRMKDLMSKLG